MLGATIHRHRGCGRIKFQPSGYRTIVWGMLSGILTLAHINKDKLDAINDSAAVMARFPPKDATIGNLIRKGQRSNRALSRITSSNSRLPSSSMNPSDLNE